MGKFNEIQEQVTQSFGSNSFTTKITDTTVEFDSARDSFTFKDEVNVPSLNVAGAPVSAQVQSDWNQNDDTKADYVKNRTHYSETGFATLMEDTFTDPYVEGIVYSFNTLSSDLEMEEGKTYRITMFGQEYVLEAIETESFPVPHVVYGDIEENPENPTSGSFLISANYRGFVASIASDTEITSIDIKIEGTEETIHQLADKFLSDNIARVSDLPAQAFELDESIYNIVSKFTNETNTVTATGSLIASAPSVANMTVGGQGNLVVTGSAASTDTIDGSSNIVLSNTSYLNAAGSNNIVISAYGASQVVDSTEFASILIGGAGGVKLKSGGYQKTMIQPNYGAEINADHSTIICGSGKINGGNSTIFASLSDANEMYGGNNLILGGGNSFVAKIGDSSHQQNSGNSIVANANGTGTISDGAGNTISFSQGGNFTISGGATNTILGCSGSTTISGGTMNAIIAGYGSITIPATTAYTVVLGNPAGNSAFTASESNTVYMQNANASGILTLGTLKIKDDSGVLKVSDDGGTTWKTVTLS